MIARFAGHVARLSSYDPSRLMVEILHYRNRKWLDLLESQNGGAQLPCRKLKVWRWEQFLVKHFGRDWEELAQDRRACDDLARDPLTYR